MRLLIVGTLERPAHQREKIAMDEGANVTHARDMSRRSPCCAPARAPTC